jgi:DNA invertase Pin-like site-specific DNA recombinase
MKRIAIYGRESHLYPVENQLGELCKLAEQRGLKVAHQFVDDGDQCLVTNAKLTGLTAMLKAASERSFKSLLVWDISMLGNSVPSLVQTMRELASLDVSIEFVKQNIDTGKSDNQNLTEFLEAVLHFEKTLISEKIRAGQRRAANLGRTTGRPTNMTDSVRTAVRLLHRQGLGKKRIAKELRVGVGSVIAAL